MQWAAFHLKCSNGIYLFKSVSWCFLTPQCDMLEVFCDASRSGMGFWYPSLNVRFQSSLPTHSPVTDIFFYKVPCVSSAIHDSMTRLPVNGRLAVFTDSLNTVYMFNTLLAGSGYNRLLMDAIETILIFDVDFRVFHVAGEDNIVADHLSWWRTKDALLCSPGLRISPLQPPRLALGAVQK